MNRDDIIRMAREAGFGFMTEKPKSATHMQCGIDDLERFAALVAVAEREACAKLIEDYLSVGLAKEMARIIRDH